MARADPHAKIVRTAEKLRKADADATRYRRELRDLMRAGIASGDLTKSSIARALGVSRQRVQQMLGD